MCRAEAMPGLCNMCCCMIFSNREGKFCNKRPRDWPADTVRHGCPGYREIPGSELDCKVALGQEGKTMVLWCPPPFRSGFHAPSIWNACDVGSTRVIKNYYRQNHRPRRRDTSGHLLPMVEADRILRLGPDPPAPMCHPTLPHWEGAGLLRRHPWLRGSKCGPPAYSYYSDAPKTGAQA